MVREAKSSRLGDIFGDRLIVLGAHPDDCELMAGGLLCSWTGTKKAIFVTTMNKGQPQKQVVRQREIASSMEVLGVEDYEVGPAHDAELVHDGELTRYFERLFRQFEPTVVVTHKADDFHQDHRAISWGVEAALRRSPAMLLQGESYLWPHPSPNLYVDITRDIATKRKALSCYRSIIENGTFDPDAVTTFHRMRGTQSFRFRYAECFRLVRALLDRPGNKRA